METNPLLNRPDVERTLLEILAPLSGRYSAGHAGYDLGAAGASYAPSVARMEGFSRVLWGVAPLLAGGGTFPQLEKHLEGLARGTDPEDAAYWGTPGEKDQRFVEMAAIALSLGIAPERFWAPLNEETKRRVYDWLAAIETGTLPENNWHFFRVLVCSAFRLLGLPVDESAESESFALIESLYQGDGWYVDGCNGNYDFYNPFGFHFYGLVYARLMGDRFPERAARYIERARLFAPQFLAFFTEDGANIPYGRSLTYRFAAVSFFSACAFADVEAVPWPVMKGVVLRSLRWWFSRPIMDAAGALTVGYAYPNLVMAEQYNSPTSPYWALKAYLMLALGDSHPFWLAAEAPLPAMPPATRLTRVHFVVNRSKEDAQLLNPGRYPSWEAVQSAAKYGKFAYSARFGFCVSRGSYALEQTGCDSMLVLSEGDGYWRERRATTKQRSGDNWTAGTWKPWPDVEIDTVLVALGDGHVRLHDIRSGRTLLAVEGGFSLPRFSSAGSHETMASATDTEAAALSAPWGASRIDGLDIVDIANPARSASNSHRPSAVRIGEIVELSPNLNLLYPNVAVPALRGTIRPGRTIWACFVRAGDADPTVGALPSQIARSAGSLLIKDSKGRILAEIGTNGERST